MRIIDADALKEDFKARLEKAKNWKENALNRGDDEIVIRATATIDFICEVIMTINYAPTVEIPNYGGQVVPDTLQGWRYEERPQGMCKTCKYYHPYCEQFSNKPRGDGYCVIARMTPEGMTTINCDDEFGCSDYQKGGAE